MAFKYVRQLFIDGMNQDMDPAAIDLAAKDDVTVTLLSSVQNLVFERGLVQTRPPESTFATFNSGGLVQLYTPTYSGLTFFPNQILVLNGQNVVNASLYTLTLSAPYLLTALTGPGPGTGFATAPVGSSTCVNGVVLMAGIVAGMLRWDPTTTVYTQLTTQPAWQYVTKLYSRAIGAVNMNQTLGNMMVGASAAGNEQDWTSLNAYSATLADIDDYITGLGVLRGTVVLARSKGFHLGFPTGQFPNVFNWSSWSDSDIGVMYPSTLDFYNHICYFVSTCGVHTFDLNQVVDIGEGIYNELNFWLNQQGVVVRGFITPSYKKDYRPFYNIMVYDNNTSTTILHWIYDIREGKWSRQVYTATANSTPFWGFPFYNAANAKSSAIGSFPPGLGMIEVVSSGLQKLHVVTNFDSTNPVNISAATFTTGQFEISPGYVDSGLSKILLSIFVPVATTTVPSISVTAILGNATQTVNFTPTVVGLSAGWNRLWYSGRIVGQFFQITGTLAANQFPFPTKIKEMFLEFTDQGKERL